MINIGDSIKYNNKDYIVRHVHNPLFKSKQEVAHIVIQNKDETISLPFTSYYRELYEMETQYSNELEKRWNDMKDKVATTYVELLTEKPVLAQYIGSMLCIMDELEGKENVFETLQKLQEVL